MKRAVGERCRWCGRPLPTPAATGRPRRYCRAGCRQQAHLARKFAHAHGLSDDEVVVDRQQFEQLGDLVYLLEAAIEDVEADLTGSPSAREVRSALDWLLDNARPVVQFRVEPKAES